MLAAGSATFGRSGATAFKSTETGGVQRNLPKSNFDRSILIGTTIIDLVNNAASPVNVLQGPASAAWTLNAPFIASVINADFIARAILSVTNDSDSKNYHTITDWADNYSGDAPEVYAYSKFGSFRGQIDWGQSGAASAVALSFDGLSADPLSLVGSGGVAALTTPAAGALSAGRVLSACQASLTGVSDYMRLTWNFRTGLMPSPGPCVASSNPLFNSRIRGLIQTGLGGTVTITQHKRAATLLSQDGTDGALGINIGTTGAGVALSVALIGMGISRRSNLGINYRDTTYQLKSVDGTALAVAVADL